MASLIIGGRVYCYGRIVKARPNNQCVLVLNGETLLPGQAIVYDTPRPLTVESSLEGQDITIT